MPLQGIYSSWEQNKEKVFLTIPLKGVSPSKVDITVQGFVLKVNFVPYLLDITLSHEIDTLKHKATVNKRGELRIELFKKEPNVQWAALEASGDDEELQKRRLESGLVDEALNRDLQAQRADAKIAEEKYSLRKQMALEEAERNKLDQIKLEEKQAAEKEVYAAFRELEQKEAEKKGKKSVSFDRKEAPSSALGTGPPTTVSESLYDIDEEEEIEEQKPSISTKKETVTELSSSAPEKKSIFGSVKSEQQIRQEEPQEPQTETQYEVVEEQEEEDVRYVPPPRQMLSSDGSRADSVKVGINFTPRAFPTPMRESKAAEEEDWVARNRKHLKKHGVLGKNVPQGGGAGDVSEEDPSWLKAKGDDFFRYGDYRSAINAYTAAVEADEKMAACYSNRSICYLKCHMYADCVNDCITAVDLLRPSCQVKGDKQNPHNSEEAFTNVVKVIKLLMRKGTASAHLGDFAAATAEYREAQSELKTLESNIAMLERTAVDKEESVLGASWLTKNMKEVTLQSIETDIEKLETLHTADILKKEGDSLFADQNLSAALLKYSEVLSLVPVHVSCLANRSAVKMAEKDFTGCIEDCTYALELMDADGDNSRNSGALSSSGASMLETILPPAGGEKRVSWQVKTLLRRGVAYSQMALINSSDCLKCLDSAVKDYSKAVALDPKNETLKSDLNKLMTFRESKKKDFQ